MYYYFAFQSSSEFKKYQ